MLSSQEQCQIQHIINVATAEQREELRLESQNTLINLNWLMGQKLLEKEEKKAGEIAIEMIVRLEATEKGKGFFFRTKRRVQVLCQYLNS